MAKRRKMFLPQRYQSRLDEELQKEWKRMANTFIEPAKQDVDAFAKTLEKLNFK